MRDHVTLDTTPADEPAAQLGEPGYGARARAEGAARIALLRRHLGPEPAGARFWLHEARCDFGTYLEVRLDYDDADRAQAAYAARVEDGGPSRWDPDLRPGAVLGAP